MTTIEQFQAMLERHGYEVATVIPDYRRLIEQAAQGPLNKSVPSPHMMINRPGSLERLVLYLDDVTTIPDEGVQSILEKLADGQAYMQCSSCGLPVLVQHVTEVDHPIMSNVSFKLDTDGFPTFEVHGSGQIEAWDEYRLVSAGPQSEPITHCTQCGIELNEKTIQDIED